MLETLAVAALILVGGCMVVGFIALTVLGVYMIYSVIRDNERY